jgi:hypothetical protein
VTNCTKATTCASFSVMQITVDMFLSIDIRGVGIRALHVGVYFQVSLQAHLLRLTFNFPLS